MHLENTIERYIRELNREGLLSDEYAFLYSEFIKNEKLTYIFSSLHSLLIGCFNCMNQRLPTYEYESHFWAEPSRELLKAIDWSDSLIRSLNGTEYSCSYDDYYDSLITSCKKFLSPCGGSTIPKFFDKIELYYTIPIFCFVNSISTPSESGKTYPLKAIGIGSYASVFLYYDEYYGTNFAVKKAHKNLTDKELKRFKQEFETMKALNSPYVLNVYSYDDNKNQYTMEYMDKTLDEYIKENNSTLGIEKRKGLILQVLKAFSYLHSKDILHRDISPRNILLKIYDDTVIVKISDFGLVKIPESTLTSENTEFKGYFNDPALVVDGFSNYSMEHETYALTRLIVYILTGKINIDKVRDKKLIEFINKGLNADRNLRFKNVNELKETIINILN